MSNIFRRKTFKRPVKKTPQAPAPAPAQAVAKPQKAKPRPVVRRRRKELIEEAPQEVVADTNAVTEETVSEQALASEAEAIDSPAVSEEVTTSEPTESSQEAAVADTPQDNLNEPNEAAKPVQEESTEESETAKGGNQKVAQETAPKKTFKTVQSITEVEKTPKPRPTKAYPKLGKAVIAPPPEYGKTTPPPANTGFTQTQDSKDQWRKKNAEQRTEKDELGRAKKGKRRSKDKDRVGRHRIEMRMDDLPSPSARRRRSRGRGGVKKASPKAKAIKRRVFMDDKITVAQLAHEMHVKGTVVLKKLIAMGEMLSLNDEIDFDTAKLLAEEYDFQVVNTAFDEDKYLIQNDSEKEEGEKRPAIVTIMGHVDHGKTTLLDTIRKANVASGEAGGITQHISAYQVEKNGELLTFIDTPGHEAFTAMRARGAQVTDIVVLVVAADDGIMPQTIEAISHAKAAGVQILVAVNKCDRPNANPMNVRQQMMQHELVPEEYGGETIFCDISALKGDGIDELIDNLILMAEMGEYSAPTNMHAEGTVLEARLEKGRGPVATVIVKKGILKTGQSLVLGKVWGRVRAMNDFKNTKIKAANPSTPVEIIGLQDVPSAGDDFVVVKNDKDARALTEHRLQLERDKGQTKAPKLTLEDLLARQEEGEIITLNLILKSDVGGTLEAMKASLDKIDVPGTDVKILHSGVGGITEGDISLAHTYEGIVIGFNVRPDGKARRAEAELNVQVKTYKVIYEALEDIEKALQGLLKPASEEKVQGLAEIRQIFNVPKVGTVAGCFVQDGKIARSHKVRLLRDSVVIWEGRLASLQRFKDAVREVEKGYECGMNLDGFNDIKPGDQIETFTIEDVTA